MTYAIESTIGKQILIRRTASGTLVPQDAKHLPPGLLEELSAAPDEVDGVLVTLQMAVSLEPPDGEHVVTGYHVDEVSHKGSDLSFMFDQIAQMGLSFEFPAACYHEVARAISGAQQMSAEGDFRRIPFVTIDGAGTRDLDQAVFSVMREEGHFVEVLEELDVEVEDATTVLVCYAIADASHYVTRGSALFSEALTRGSSVYGVELSVPMLPRELSEGLISLNEDEDRRAICFVMQIDADGTCIKTDIHRGLVRSAAKLSSEEVAAFYDDPDASDLAKQDFASSLIATAIAAELRLEEARSRDVVPFNRIHLDVSMTPGNAMFESIPNSRSVVEQINEQLSLLCNMEGAKILLQCSKKDRGVDAIFRNHAAPSSQSLKELEQVISDVVMAQGMGNDWFWKRGAESLADYLTRLPAIDESGQGRWRAAIERQILMTQRSSTYSSKAGLHSALGVCPYGRFSAPMRELVGIYTHQELLFALGLEPEEALSEGESHRLRDEVIEAGNRSREQQRRLDKEVMSRVVSNHLWRDMSSGERPMRRATLLGMKAQAFYVRLDESGLELKVYVEDVEAHYECSFVQNETKTQARSDDDQVIFTLGDAVGIQVDRYDDTNRRWRVLMSLG